jgi:uncharacterized membrane protein
MHRKITDASEGWTWLVCGWRLFTKDPAIWVVLLLIFFVIVIALSAVPLIGGLAVALVSPVLMGGLMYAARESDGGRALDIGQLFAGFSDSPKLNRLLVVGAIALVGNVIIGIIGLVSFGGVMMSAFMAASGGNVAINPLFAVSGFGWITLFVGIVVMLVVWALVLMATLYAPALVMLREVEPIEAVKSSFMACLANWLPLTVFGIVYLVLAIVAAIPLFLGFLILAPVSVCAIYCSYLSIYGAQQQLPID